MLGATALGLLGPLAFLALLWLNAVLLVARGHRLGLALGGARRPDIQLVVRPPVGDPIVLAFPAHGRVSLPDRTLPARLAA